MPNLEVWQSDEIALAGIERLRRGDQIRNAGWRGRLADQAQRRPDWIIALVQPLEGHVAERMGHIRARENPVGVSVLQRVDAIHRQILAVACAEAAAIARTPEEVAEALIGGRGGLKLRNHLARSNNALPERCTSGDRLAVGRLKGHWIGKGGVAAAIVVVLRAVELRTVRNAEFEGVVGSRKRLANQCGHRS